MLTHYGNAMEPATLLHRAIKLARWLIDYTKNHPADKKPLLVYTGMSGVSYATAVALCLRQIDPGFNVAQLYVRKETESSHSSTGEDHKYELFAAISHPDSYDMNPKVVSKKLDEKYYPVFVDDFVCEGETFFRCMNKFHWPIESWTLLLDGYPVTSDNFGIIVYEGNTCFHKKKEWGLERYPHGELHPGIVK